ncbi:hypothetical protein Mgra_00008925, partial [Meloidogyne graminicola]
FCLGAQFSRAQNSGAQNSGSQKKMIEEDE